MSFSASFALLSYRKKFIHHRNYWFKHLMAREGDSCVRTLRDEWGRQARDSNLLLLYCHIIISWKVGQRKFLLCHHQHGKTVISGTHVCSCPHTKARKTSSYLKIIQFKNKTTIWSNNPTSGCISEGNEITILKRYHSHVHYSIIHNSHYMEATRVHWWVNG